MFFAMFLMIVCRPVSRVLGLKQVNCLVLICFLSDATEFS